MGELVSGEIQRAHVEEGLHGRERGNGLNPMKGGKFWQVQLIIAAHWLRKDGAGCIRNACAGHSGTLSALASCTVDDVLMVLSPLLLPVCCERAPPLTRGTPLCFRLMWGPDTYRGLGLTWVIGSPARSTEHDLELVDEF